MPPAAPVTRTVCMMHSFEDERLVSTVAELGGEPLIPLAAVAEVPAHRGARLRHRAAADRLHDVAVLPLKGLVVGAPRHPGSARDCLPRDDEAAQMLQKPPELRVSGSIGDGA